LRRRTRVFCLLGLCALAGFAAAVTLGGPAQGGRLLTLPSISLTLPTATLPTVTLPTAPPPPPPVPPAPPPPPPPQPPPPPPPPPGPPAPPPPPGQTTTQPPSGSGAQAGRTRRQRRNPGAPKGTSRTGVAGRSRVARPQEPSTAGRTERRGKPAAKRNGGAAIALPRAQLVESGGGRPLWPAILRLLLFSALAISGAALAVHLVRTFRGTSRP
jgi:outer membrane biosynthesis protein TonB